MVEMIEAGEKVGPKVVRSLWPRRGTHGNTCYPWRQNIAFAVIVLVLAVPCWAFIAYGVAEPTIPGFVTTNTFVALSEKVDFLTQDRMETLIQGKFWDTCVADGASRREAQAELARLQMRYRTMFGHGDFPTGTCK